MDSPETIERKSQAARRRWAEMSSVESYSRIERKKKMLAERCKRWLIPKDWAFAPKDHEK